MKILYFDIETTGLKHWRNGIHQISGAIEIDGSIKEFFDFKVCPYLKCDVEKEALEIGGVTEEQILNYPPMPKVYSEFIQMLTKYVDKFNKQDKFFLCGYNNAGFDNNFIRAWFVQSYDNYFGSWFWSSSLDVMVLAAEYLKEKRHMMKDFKLATVAQTLGIEVDETKTHDAKYDIQLTIDIYKIVTKK